MANDSTVASFENKVAFLKLKVKSLFDNTLKTEKALSLDNLRHMTDEQLDVRMDFVNKTESTFTLTHDNLEELDYDEIGSQLRKDFEELIVNNKSVLLREIRKRQTQIGPCSTSTMRREANIEGSTTIIHQRKSNVPELKLPEFSGGYTEYANFLALFSSIIDRDQDLTDIEKLQHLMTCLKGPALDAIRSLEITSDNYAVAKDILHRRFNNKRSIFQAHIVKILGLQRVESPSAQKLREMSDAVNANIRSLQSLGNKEQIADAIIVHVLLQKVDSATRAKWEETAPADEIPSCGQFTMFLENRCLKLENVERSAADYAVGYEVGKNNNTNPSRSSLIATNTLSNACVCCNDVNHQIYTCPQFVNLSPQLRFNESKRLGLCLNCLKKGHQLRNCNSGACRSCGSKHHSLLHLSQHSDVSQPQVVSSQAAQPSSSSSSSNSTSLLAQNSCSDFVFLATALVNVRDRSGQWIPCRALLDSGSQLHIITSFLAHKLQLPRNKSTAVVSGLGDSRFHSEGFSVNVSLMSRTSEFSTNITALVAPAITDNQPNFIVNSKGWNIPGNIRLADPEFYRSSKIDMLIGAGLFFELLCVGQIKLAGDLTLLQKTRLGWIVTGGAKTSHNAVASGVQFNESKHFEAEISKEKTSKDDVMLQLIEEMTALQRENAKLRDKTDKLTMDVENLYVDLARTKSWKREQDVDVLEPVSEDDEITRATIMHFHRRTLHSGPRSLPPHTRLQYWTIGGHKTLSAPVKKCKGCFRTKPRLAKHIMADRPKDRVLGSHTFVPSFLPFDDLCTLVCHIAAIINSEFLVSLPENPADLNLLTPAHCLGTATLALLPEPDIAELNLSRLDRWQRVSYLTLLNQRSKWLTPNPGVQLNDVVLAKDENIPPLKWPLARVVELICGDHGVARVAVLKTATGATKRAVRKLSVLPKQDDVGIPRLPTGGVCLVMQRRVDRPADYIK